MTRQFLIRGQARILSLALVAPSLIALAAIIAGGPAQAKPGQPFAPCTGKKIDPHGACSKASQCLGSDPCSSWVESTEIWRCTSEGAVAGDNCRPNTELVVNCGLRGLCGEAPNGTCVQIPGMWPIETNPVVDGGTCFIPAGPDEQTGL